ncbi:NAD(+)/NADH kinase [Methanoplanus sp. FWC-SCC4]|uniref:NAD kinase n=1 Tax=Methanochimaera problematica TaxID=2609417 RepID=A0AA97I3S2_9EURY|nr:NAD(+)/NADH kinase [Methanoplanus sp. FWC-SCC4]WOF16196.1 NAD(+)/NADH kinase [Methanoplanus sp. FWC-SCC4]
MKFAMVIRPDDPGALEIGKRISLFLKNRGHEIVYELETSKALNLKEGVSFSRLSGDVAVVIGGDGTVLHTIRQLEKQIPLIGINRGNVGFLTDLEPDEAEEYLLKIEKGKYNIENRMRLHLLVDDEYVGEALNEAVIVTSRPAKILQFTINIDYVPAERFRADGVLISTPTGSTAYAMSAGGPIVDPWIDGFLLVPLAPYYLSSRPHIISDKRKLRVELDSTKPADLVLDGQYIMELYNGNVVTIQKSREPALFINAGKNFFAKVDSKLKSL